MADEYRGGRLGEDQAAPFRFRKGDAVAFKRQDGSEDQVNRGVIVDGHCYYTVPSGSYVDYYVVRRSDGKYLYASGLELIEVAKKKP